MSKAIKRLENELGAELFARSTRRTVLTPTGEIVFAHCEEIFGSVDKLHRSLEEVSSVVGGTLRIGAMEVFSLYLLPTAIGELAAKHPNVLTKSYEMHPDLMERRLVDGELDIGFTVGGSGSTKIDYVPLGTSPGVIVCGRGHPLFGTGRITAQQLGESPFVVPEFLGREGLPRIDMFPDERHPRRAAATIELLQMGIRMAASGAFLGYFPEVSVRDHLRDGSLEQLDGAEVGPPFELRALTRAGSRPKRAAGVLTDEIKTALAAR